MSQYDTTILPCARLDDLVTTESGDELLVYDTKTHVIHHLNPTATTIWRLLDGQQTLGSLERSASAILGVDVSREVVESALTSLDGLDLLDGHVAFDPKPANSSRRRFLKRAAAAGVAIPAIASITAPAAHASDGSCPTYCPGYGGNAQPACCQNSDSCKDMFGGERGDWNCTGGGQVAGVPKGCCIYIGD